MGFLQTSITAAHTADFAPSPAATIYLIDATAGDLTVTLPVAHTSPHSVYEFRRTDASGHTVTVAGAQDSTVSPAIADTVNGAASVPLAAGSALCLVSDGATGWYDLSSNASGGAALDTANTWTAPQTFPAHTTLASTDDAYLDLNSPTGHTNILGFQTDGTEYWEFFGDAHTFGVYHTPTNVTRISVNDAGIMGLNYQLNLGYALTLPANGGGNFLAFEGPCVTVQQWPNTGTVAPDSLVLQTSPFTVGDVGTGTGSSLCFQADSSADSLQDQARLTATWGGDATTATRAARLTATVDDYAGAREGWRIEADGSAPRIGFLGAGAVARPTVTGSRGGNAALASLLTALAALGLITDSSS